MTCSLFVIWGGLYGVLRYGVLDLDTLINLMNHFDFTSRGVDLVREYPQV